MRNQGGGRPGGWEGGGGEDRSQVSGFSEHLLCAGQGGGGGGQGLELVSTLTPHPGSEGVYYCCHCCCFSGILFNFRYKETGSEVGASP